MTNTVEVEVDFIKKAFNAACQNWKKILVDKFPTIDFGIVKKGMFVKSNTTSLVVLVTKTSITKDAFTGVVIVTDGIFEVGYISSNWSINEGHIYTEETFDLNEIFKK